MSWIYFVCTTTNNLLQGSSVIFPGVLIAGRIRDVLGSILGLTILTEDLQAFPQSHQTNTEIVPSTWTLSDPDPYPIPA